jgi:hypothetical protein
MHAKAAASRQSATQCTQTSISGLNPACIEGSTEPTARRRTLSLHQIRKMVTNKVRIHTGKHLVSYILNTIAYN